MGSDELRTEAAQEGRWQPGGTTYDEEVAKAQAELEASGIVYPVGGFPGEPAHPRFPTAAFSQVLGYLRWYTNDDDVNFAWYARIALEEYLLEMGGPQPAFRLVGNIVTARED